MSEFLSQEEVDAIVSAVQESQAQNGAGRASGGPHKRRSNLASEDEDVTLYNFRRPDRVSKEQLRSLEIIHDSFSRNLSVSLSGYLRSLVEVNRISVDQMTYNEFLLALPNPTCFNIYSAAPLEGNVIIEFNPTVAFPIIDRLLGGKGKALDEVRSLTDMEQQMLDGFLGRIIDAFCEAWKDIVPLKFSLEAKETNPQIAQIVALSEIVVLLVFEIKVGETTGFLNFCIPFLALEPLAEKLTLQYRFSFKKAQDEKAHLVRELVDRVHIPLTIELGKLDVTVKEIVDLRVGDVINLSEPVSKPLVMSIVDRPKFLVKPGVKNRKKAIQITSKYVER